ncbi:MAG: hypothetical protein ACKV2V_27620, partial [Blastocatellia bacterium]
MPETLNGKTEHDAFYVGYLPAAPPAIARRVRAVCLILLAVTALTALALVFGQKVFPRAVFEFQQYRDFEGIVRAKPHPMLFVRRPGISGAVAAYSQYLLVGEGKQGADAIVAGLDGKTARVRGALIYRDGVTMIEVVSAAAA